MRSKRSDIDTDQYAAMQYVENEMIDAALLFSEENTGFHRFSCIVRILPRRGVWFCLN